MLPQYSDIELPLLLELQKRGGSARPSERNASGRNVYEELALHFGLSQADLDETIYEKNGTPRSKWENVVRWVRNDLKKKGMIFMPSHGIWALTETAHRYMSSLTQRSSGLR